MTARIGEPMAVAADALDERRVAVLGRLTAQFAHELRNVLTGVRCYLELLGGVELPDDVAGFLVEVDAGLDRMTGLASGWLAVSRGGSATAYLNGEVHRLVRLLEAAGLGKRIRFELALDESAGVVAAAPERLSSALFVLLGDLAAGAPAVVRIATRVEGARTRLDLVAEPGPVAWRDDLALIGQALGCPVEPRAGGAGVRLWLDAADGGEDGPTGRVTGRAAAR